MNPFFSIHRYLNVRLKYKDNTFSIYSSKFCLPVACSLFFYWALNDFFKSVLLVFEPLLDFSTVSVLWQ